MFREGFCEEGISEAKPRGDTALAAQRSGARVLWAKGKECAKVLRWEKPYRLED